MKKKKVKAGFSHADVLNAVALLEQAQRDVSVFYPCGCVIQRYYHPWVIAKYCPPHKLILDPAHA